MKFEFKNAHGRKEVSGEDLEMLFAKMYRGFRGWANYCFVNGEPYNHCSVLDYEEGNIHKAVFRCQLWSAHETFAFKYWRKEKNDNGLNCPKTAVELSDVVGCDWVDVYADNKFIGTYPRVLIKE